MKRNLLTLAAYLLVGAVVTVVVAWACALWVPRPVLGSTRWFDGGAAWPMPVDSTWPPAPNALFAGRKAGYRISGAQSLWVRQSPTRRLIERQRLEINDLGWPLPALRWHSRIGADRQMSLHHTVPMPGMLRSTARSPDRQLPGRPLWGAIGNVIFFAALAWLVVGGPMALQRAARAWRGSCVGCGYDLRASVGPGCPECGYGRGAARTP